MKTPQEQLPSQRLLHFLILNSPLTNAFPAWISLEDIEQEVWLALCHRERRCSLKLFVRGVLIDILRKVRAPRKHRGVQYDQALSRQPISLDDISDDDAFAPYLSEDPTQRLEARDLLRKIWQRSTPSQRKALVALQAGSSHEAAQALGVSDAAAFQSRAKLRNSAQKLLAEID